jgi:hypothetical protein
MAPRFHPETIHTLIEFAPSAACDASAAAQEAISIIAGLPRRGTDRPAIPSSFVPNLQVSPVAAVSFSDDRS